MTRQKVDLLLFLHINKLDLSLYIPYGLEENFDDVINNQMNMH